MAATQLVLETFSDFDEAVERLQQIKWTGRDVGNLSIAVRDRGTDMATKNNVSRGDRLEIGTLELPVDRFKPLKLDMAQFYCEEIGGINLAGPLYEWALNEFMKDDTYGGLHALRAGLEDMGASPEEVSDCAAQVKRGRVLIMLPEPEPRPRKTGSGRDGPIRISDAAKYE